MDLIVTILPVVTKNLPISPRFTPYGFLSRCKFSTLTTRQLMVEFYLLTFPRFLLRKKEHKSYFGKNRTHDFRTSRCAGYLLDHSGNEGNKENVEQQQGKHASLTEPLCHLEPLRASAVITIQHASSHPIVELAGGAPVQPRTTPRASAIIPFSTQALIPSWNWRITSMNIDIICGGTPKRASTC